MTNKHEKKQAQTIFLGILLIEGCAALFWLLRKPSMQSNAWLLGYSWERILLAVAVIGMLVPLAVMTARSRYDVKWAARQQKKWESRIIDRGWLLPLTLILIAIFLGAAALLIVFLSPLQYRLHTALMGYPAGYQRAVDLIGAAFQYSAGIILWAGLSAGQSSLWLLVYHKSSYRDSLKDGRFYPFLLGIFIAVAVLFHWVVLIFQLKVFLVIRGWKWYFTPKPPLKELWAFAGFFLLAILIFILVLVKPSQIKRNLVLLVLTGFGLQIGFGFIGGQGFETLRLKYADSSFTAYAQAAAEEPGLITALRQYESHYGADPFLGTKPPGILIPYIAMEKFSNRIWPEPTADGRFFRLTQLLSYTFPLFAFLVIFALYYFGRSLFQDSRNAVLPGLYYVVLPNVILIPLFLDQVLYPLIFMLVLILVLRTLQKPTFSRGFAAGAAIFAAIYFNFSLLTLMPFSILWLCIDHWQNRSRRPIQQTITALFGLGMGFIFLFILFRLGLNYDFFLRYASAFKLHGAIDFETRLEQIGNSLILNNAEMITWTGFPIALLFLSQTAHSVLAFFKGRDTRLDGLVITFVGAYAGLLIFGRTNSEVQRLFLFLEPLIVLFAANHTITVFKKRSTAFIFIAAAQIITILFIFLFQDFYA